ncbi:MAG: hypothetical protein A3G33_01000 [Omnitrophica bacterium RIFCSPLOWO2_12_FULL_44_17]|uniref:4Fe-4S ferredoxin-type domain-containing protein n=1 Tax=Candidatus Danuiimicrobium aquiferis TaxID=1801832 RepID=A0A1G1L2T7_9BACT|nr:MAG: hypothetical protein A3B72_06555 [Omnitrophica bacterium RIFCSPHIGHO2_02_FULL_45_28]OGW89670.1 MAG: hypothetical protein A3E74_04740 [Omnitrophica bacterium RIFCSPHIGHO2_12_FULL_44_12]OGW99480.1 MAG: hypothetical protein A3G33_01000 [Omnitrophica bacterium RIFCSPLOWO2_12_FULL_44_17]OGX04316.1 MAG: hypothetical protein A3J12_00710 [Omnitrophica bacterium RIFCSPLOWO2_02_FULL_44_11]
MSKCVFLWSGDLKSFIGKLSETYQVYLPVKKGTQRFYKKYVPDLNNIVMGEVRPFEPLKAFFFRAKEVVAESFENRVPSPPADKPLAILGVKACDLKGFKVEDFVFSNNTDPDPFYLKNRERNLIISSDCTCAIDTCFCLALGLKPFPQENFDLNFSPIQDGYIVEVGSSKGESLIKQHTSYFKEVAKVQEDERYRQRNQVLQDVETNLKQFDVPSQDRFQGAVERNFDSKIWEDEAKTCVECGACNAICPTCHCFLLYDQKDEKKMERLRIWDSCMIKDFARVAGGANPRKKLWMRLRNRFEKKFDFFPKVANVYACTGCGRCISACPAKIDIRKVLKRLVIGS